MGAYRTILVGTDGSDTSLRAVERAAALAADAGARMVIVCAYHPSDPADLVDAQDALGPEAFQILGSAPAEDNLRRARDRAVRAGAGEVDTLAVDGNPVEVIGKAAKQHSADLIVVGNRGLNSLSGRILGSVPADVARRSGVDVLIVHTS
jgi:nucleotide-binding universal stress UspA family protein